MKLHDEINSVLGDIDDNNGSCVIEFLLLMIFQNYNILKKYSENQ